MKTRLITIICVLSLCMAGTTYADETRDPAMVVADAIVVRPFCLVATVLGSAFFVIALPFAAGSHSVNKVADVLVKGPARATFTRPLGNFESLRAEEN